MEVIPPEAPICRRCLKQKPITTIYESPNGHISLGMCAECSAIMDALEEEK